MNTIEINALTTYQKNIEYFKNHQPALYEKLQTLEIAIQENVYTEQYALEYKEGYFDVQELATKEFLYNENSIFYSQNLVSVIDHKKTGAVFEAQRNVEYSPNMPDIIDKSELSFHNALWATIKIIDYVKRYAPKSSTSMRQVYKAIFLDVGLGIHIPALIEKLNIKILFIKEKNLELFRLSLFVTNYAQIAENTFCFYSIMDDEETLKKNYLAFLEKGNNYNLYIKYIPFSHSYEQDLERFQNFNISQEHIYYPYSAFLLRSIDAPKYIAKGEPFLNIATKYHQTYFSNKPILLVFSGPSTGKNLQWIQKNQNKFIIISPLSACKFLFSNKIYPDIIFHIDPSKEDAVKLLDGIDKSCFDNATFVFSSNLHEDIAAYFNNNTKYFMQQGTSYKKDFGYFSAPTVGEYTYAISLILGATQLYLLGIDLALDPDTLESHSPLHPYLEKGSLVKDVSAEQLIDKNIIFTKGNFRSSVPTFSSFKISIDEFKRFSQFFKEPYQNVYNLSDGAYLEGATPLHINELDLGQVVNLDKSIERVNIQSFFNTISSATFREEDKEILRYQIKEAKNLMKIIKHFQKEKHKDYKQFLEALRILSWKLGDMENKTQSNLAEVYYYYFKVVLSYIFDLFNTRELTNYDQAVKELKILLITQLEKIGNKFILTLESYLE